MLRKATTMSDIFADLDLIAIEKFAADKCPRTILRWIDQPDGMRSVKVGAERFIHIATAKAWIMSRLKTRRPSARRGRA